MDVSILHISDLHRHAEHPISNKVLHQTLIQDRDRYVEDGVRAPDLIVVSGDIIQGATTACADPQKEIKRQYDEAENLLGLLSDSFLGGDRARLVVVPGNHDVSDFRFRRSLSQLPVAQGHAHLVSHLFRRGSPIRWDWKELSFYEVTNLAQYHARFEEFGEFYKSLYRGSRSFSMDVAEQFGIFDFPTLRVTIVGFNSCHNNDLLNRTADIHPDCVASASTVIRQVRSLRPLPIAVWHHNTEAPHYNSDCLHSDHVQCMMDAGFSLALHGHQHKPESLRHTFKYKAQMPLPVVSAGTLCGPPGASHARSYNLIELDLLEGHGRLHVRENVSSTDMPMWVCRSLPGQQQAHARFQFPKLPIMKDEMTAIQEARQRMESDDHEAAADLLRGISSDHPMARLLLLECYGRLRSFQSIVDEFSFPASVREAISLLNALYHLNDKAHMVAALNVPAIRDATNAALIELRDKYKRKFGL